MSDQEIDDRIAEIQLGIYRKPKVFENRPTCFICGKDGGPPGSWPSSMALTREGFVCVEH